MKTIQNEIEQMLVDAFLDYWKSGRASEPEILNTNFTAVRTYLSATKIFWKFNGWQDALRSVRRGELGIYRLNVPIGTSAEYMAGFKLLESVFSGVPSQRFDRSIGVVEPGVRHVDGKEYWSPYRDVENLGSMIIHGDDRPYETWMGK